MKKRFRILIKGDVQGVFFRKFVEEHAYDLQITGYVRNVNHDGVEVIAEGEEDQLNALLTFCKSGPPTAYVEKVSVQKEPCRNQFDVFKIDC